MVVPRLCREKMSNLLEQAVYALGDTHELLFLQFIDDIVEKEDNVGFGLMLRHYITCRIKTSNVYYKFWPSYGKPLTFACTMYEDDIYIGKVL
jgi:hypothetical protein